MTTAWCEIYFILQRATPEMAKVASEQTANCQSSRSMPLLQQQGEEKTLGKQTLEPVTARPSLVVFPQLQIHPSFFASPAICRMVMQK
ncbi:MAG: hypothetical protein ONB51_03530 [candidate division KSB1 bacterium]|nr:hypothetical protein [candidate division KSB1 bacterium]